MQDDREADKGTFTVALAGNPNSGKTTVFNAITGSRQHVGNYPGVTVEKKEGQARVGDVELNVVDLPGTYSLTAYSTEELVARNFLIDEHPHAVVDILDASNLERNLYLAVQIMELGAPLVLALNMSDAARDRGIEIDGEKLSELLGVPVVATVGHKGLGVPDLVQTTVELCRTGHTTPNRQVDYGHEVEPHVEQLTERIARHGACSDRPRWYALKLLEGDEATAKRIQALCGDDSEAIFAEAVHLREHIEGICGQQITSILADRRYGFIAGACAEAVTETAAARVAHSERIDRIVLSRWIGLPLFAALMYAVFQLTFTVGEPMMGWLEAGFEWLGGAVGSWWPADSESLLKSLIVDGIIGGVGGVLVFLPNILLLFLAIAFLEDSGYMARAAFIMDRLMHKIGLHGKSFIPMLIGFGCSVPAIMATRTLETRRDRLTTMLVVPLMSCGARLPIYALIIPAFFPAAWRAPMLWIIYVIGIVLAVACAWLLRATLFRGQPVPFVMELPPYRMPTLKGVMLHMWERGWLYLRKAGTIILGISIVLWAATTFPQKTTFDKDYEALGEQAAVSYKADLRTLNTDVGLGGDSELLVKAVEAELAAADEQAKYYEHQDGYAAAAEARDKAVAALAAAPGGEAMQAFLDLRDSVADVHGAFDQAVEEERLEEETPEYEAEVSRRDAALAKLAAAHPKLYPAVIRYRDEVLGPFEERLTELANEQGVETLAYSTAGRVGSGLEKVLRPCGFDWKVSTAMIGAFAAKEVFVAQMGIVHSLGAEEDEESAPLRDTLRTNYTPLQGFCIMLFCLVSAPCMATIAITKRESNSWGWAMFQLVGLTVLAWGVTTLVYQVGTLVT